MEREMKRRTSRKGLGNSMNSVTKIDAKGHTICA